MASLQNHSVALTASLAELVVLDVHFQALAHLLTLMLVALGSGFDVLASIPPIQVIFDLLHPPQLILASSANDSHHSGFSQLLAVLLVHLLRRNPLGSCLYPNYLSPSLQEAMPVIFVVHQDESYHLALQAS